ncbi:MAG: uncharacterized protein PWR30_585 [Candidatus Woesearchaeota archaeon]|nr:uncharacterized protein [Candidatus Woesearchaeota archaeon]
MKTKTIASLVVVVLIFIILFSLVQSPLNSYSIPLLAVSETDSGLKGSVAELQLQIMPGSGRVFIDSYPFNEMDLQVSTRYAKDLACKFSDVDCSRLDFFYTIRANASIIGGPSAGASISFLTIAALEGLDYDSDIALTGTINAGYIVGPVGGLKEKIDAAAEAGIKMVLIPLGEGSQIVESSELNSSELTIIEYGKSKDVDVKEVFDLYDVVFEYSGKNLSTEATKPDPTEFSKTMKTISDGLCERAFQLNASLPSSIPDSSSGMYEKSQQNLLLAINETSKSNYYSAASFCFGSLNDLLTIQLELSNLSKQYLPILINITRGNAETLKSELQKDYNTLGDLQVYAAIIERIEEAELHLDAAEELLNESTNISILAPFLEERIDEIVYTGIINSISYAINRIYSAELWQSFLGFDNEVVNLNEATLEQACISKISEVTGMLDYFSTSFPSLLEESRQILKKAQDNSEEGNYELCIYQASSAKAQLNNVMSSVYIPIEYYNKSIEGKIKAAERQISEQQNKQSFPIMGYSYLEYSKTLYELGDLYSASLYADYALELSNLDVYFNHKSSINLIPYLSSFYIRIFLFGAIFGFSLSLLFKVKSAKD